MKIWMLFLVCMGWGLAGWSQGFQLEGIGSVTVPVTLNKMTNILFPGTVRMGVKVSRDVLVQKVRGVENVIELKAARRGFPPTNLSVYGGDGRLYSFILRYVEDTAILNFQVVAAGRENSSMVELSDLPANETRLREDAYWLAGRRAFLHRRSRSMGLRLELAGTYLKDSLQWLVFRLRNRSSVGFSILRSEFYYQDRKQIKRKAVQEVVVNPVYTDEPGALAEGKKTRFATAFAPFVVPGGKRLVVELSGQDGRRLKLKIKGRLLWKRHRL